jgi:LysR family transcriptional regulator, glycine cleavage system transcriptional activator
MGTHHDFGAALGEEIVRPMCAPSLAGAIHEPANLLKLPLIESRE